MDDENVLWRKALDNLEMSLLKTGDAERCLIACGLGLIGEINDPDIGMLNFMFRYFLKF